MATSIPSTMRAVVVQEGNTVAVQEVSVPTLDDNDILVKVEAIAQNPTDWKHVAFLSLPGKIIGCDFSGTVVKLGKATTSSVAVGDHVAGFVHGSYFDGYGAFATYLKTASDLVWVVPKGTLSHEQAAAMECGLWTAAQALYHPTRLGMVEPPSKVTSAPWFFVYGGSTSVGQFAIQLAHFSGYKVVTVASPHNHELLKSFGADAVFDYKSPDVVSQIKQATGDSLHLALDTHAQGSSQSLSINAFGPGPGKLVVLLPVDQDATILRPDVEVQFTLLYTIFAREFTLGPHYYPVSLEDHAHMVQFLPKLDELFKAGHIKPNPIKLWEGGLEAVKDGLQYMKEGKVSGEKIVYKV